MLLNSDKVDWFYLLSSFPLSQSTVSDSVYFTYLCLLYLVSLYLFLVCCINLYATSYLPWMSFSVVDINLFLDSWCACLTISIGILCLSLYICLILSELLCNATRYDLCLPWISFSTSLLHILSLLFLLNFFFPNASLAACLIQYFIFHSLFISSSVSWFCKYYNRHCWFKSFILLSCKGEPWKLLPSIYSYNFLFFPLIKEVITPVTKKMLKI